MATDAQKKATAKYDKVNTRNIMFKFNLKTDADILEKLDSVDNRQGYVKELIRRDMERRAADPTPVITKTIVDGNFIEGEKVTVSIDDKEYTRKVKYSKKWGDLIITIENKEYAKYEFK